MTMPIASPIAALTTRLRSSRMCSISGMRASLPLALGARSRPREPADPVGSAGVVMYWSSSAGLVPLCLRQRDAVDGHAVGIGCLGLQVIKLPLQLLDLLLLHQRRLRRLGWLRRVYHRAAGKRSRGRRVAVFLRKVLGLMLADLQGLTQRLCRARE